MGGARVSRAAKHNRFPVEEGKTGQSGSGSLTGYSVQARFNSYRAEPVGEQIFDNRWQTVQFDRSGFGVPSSRFAAGVLAELNLMSYEQAEAMRWWFLASIEATRVGGCLCFETRLVEHKVEYSRKETPVEYLNAFDGRGDVPKDMLPPPELDTP